MNNNNILTNNKIGSAAAKTSDTTPKEEISPADVAKETRLTGLPDLTHNKSLIQTATDQNSGPESVKEAHGN